MCRMRGTTTPPGHFTRRPAIEKTQSYSHAAAADVTISSPSGESVVVSKCAHVLENEPLRATIRAGSG